MVCIINVGGEFMRFGDILRGLCEETEITQKQVATELNLLPTTLGRYICNEREPDIETIKRIANYFHVSTDYLLDYQSDRTCSHIENEVLRIFRSMTAEQQIIYVEQGKAVVRLNQKEGEKTKSS